MAIGCLSQKVWKILIWWFAANCGTEETSYIELQNIWSRALTLIISMAPNAWLITTSGLRDKKKRRAAKDHINHLSMAISHGGWMESRCICIPVAGGLHACLMTMWSSLPQEMLDQMNFKKTDSAGFLLRITKGTEVGFSGTFKRSKSCFKWENEKQKNGWEGTSTSEMMVWGGTTAWIIHGAKCGNRISRLLEKHFVLGMEILF